MTFNKAVSTTAEVVEAGDAGEEPFAIHELFYSRTDDRGVIQSGNGVFRRVSGFEWDHLVGAPHRIVRHPDTPKAVFWLLWNHIQQGKSVGAYIKNRSASGRWYWVFAVIVPIGTGYVSARIKPSTALLTQIAAIYSDLAAEERSHAIPPEQSCLKLVARLQDLGFADYANFMNHALVQETSERDATMGRSNPTLERALTTIQTSLRGTVDKQTALLTEFDELQSIPTNMRIIASRLEPSGGPISAISDNYKFSSTEISRRLEAFAGSNSNLCQTMSKTVADAMFQACVARILAELPQQFNSADRSDNPADPTTEKAMLSKIEVSYLQAARAAMIKAQLVSAELNLASGEIRRMMLGLDTIRVMGRVESGRLGASGVGLSSTIDQLDLRHAAIAEHLQGLMDLSSIVKSAVSACERQLVGG